MSEVTIAFLLIGAALVVSALVSALVQRGPISFPIIFLGTGLLIGWQAPDDLNVTIHSEALESIAIASLAFVLFLDALKIRVDEVHKDWLTPALVLGPGAVITVALIAAPAYFLLDLTWVQALLLGAVLASTDAVVVRDIVRDRRMPRPIRNILSLEAGINDVVVLPLILVLIAIANADASGALGWLKFSGEVFLVGPIVGALVAGSGSWLMLRVDNRLGVSREYQALFGVGLVLLTYVAGDAAGGDGFLAAFAGGLAVVLFNNQLCDCFMDFGETLVEMLMLLAFVLFGIVLAGLIGDVDLLPALALAVIVIFVARPLAIGLSLIRARIGMPGKLFLSWFGPRGLSSLLLALLIIQAGVPGAEMLFAIAGVVVIVSVLLHGVTATPAIALYEDRLRASTQEEERAASVGDLLNVPRPPFRRISAAQLQQRLQSDNPPTILDARTRAAYEMDRPGVPGGVRVSLDDLADWARSQPVERPIVAYCTCPDEVTSGRVAQELQELGFDTYALEGGLRAWREVEGASGRQGAIDTGQTVAGLT